MDKKANYFTDTGSPMYATEKPEPIFFLIVYSGNNQFRLMIEKCNSTRARNHRKARQAHMKKMVSDANIHKGYFAGGGFH